MVLGRLGATWAACAAILSVALVSTPDSARADVHPANVARDLTPPSRAAGLKPLSTADARAYAAAFAGVRKGDASSAAMTADDCLQGRLAYLGLTAGGRTAKPDAARAWLLRYGDLPEAGKVAVLVRGRSGSGVDQRAWARAGRLAARFDEGRGAAVDPRGQAAREAFYKGDVVGAHDLAVASGEAWIAGLSAYKLKRYAEAVERFGALTADPTRTEWVRSGAAFWAARAAVAAGRPAKSLAFLQQAARTPYTFYGLIAERQLGLDPAVTGRGVSYAAMISRPAAKSAPDVAAAVRLVASDRAAHRAAAFAQLGMGVEAGAELRTAAIAAPGSRAAYANLAEALGVQIATPGDFNPGEKFRFDLTQFPTPALDPQGGFTLDKALVYALVRQESRFDPAATSGAGAYGLMQLTAATAARISGDPGLSSNPKALHDAPMNLRLGQAYMTRLLELAKGDLLKAVASYNSGPGVLLKMARQMTEPADSLLMIESMPSAQTRDFVQRVVAGYWIYRQIFGRDSQTLDAVASGTVQVAAALDR